MKLLLFCNFNERKLKYYEKRNKSSIWIYDDELNKRLGLNRFYHLNGDIETDADGNGIYICSRWNEETKQIEDVAERVDNLSVAL